MYTLCIMNVVGVALATFVITALVLWTEVAGKWYNTKCQVSHDKRFSERYGGQVFAGSAHH